MYLLNYTQKSINDNKGQTLLVLVLFTALIGMLSILLTQELGQRQQRQLSQIEQIDRTYYATEGALYETLQHFSIDGSWPAATLDDSYVVNGVTIARHVEPSIDGDGNAVRNVTIVGDYDGIKRKVVGNDITFGGGSGRIPLNLVLSLDLSSSMWDTKVAGIFQPIGETKDSAQHFLTLLNVDSPPDRVALSGWGSNCSNGTTTYGGTTYGFAICKYDWITEEYSTIGYGAGHIANVNTKIENISETDSSSTELGTVMNNAIHLIRDYLTINAFSTDPPELDSTTAVILLSDGLTDSSNYCKGEVGSSFPSLTAYNSAGGNPVPMCSWIQAEESTLWVASNDVTIQYYDPDPGGPYTDSRKAINLETPGSYVTYQFVITPEQFAEAEGVFELRGWTISPNRDSSSVLIRFNDAPDKIWNNNNYGRDAWLDQPDLRPFELPGPGTVNVTLSYDEPDHFIDKIALQPAKGKLNAINEANLLHTAVIPTVTKDVTDIPIYTIGLGPFADDYTLNRIAQETGGQYNYSPTPAELDAIFENIVGILRENTLTSYNLNEEVP